MSDKPFLDTDEASHYLTEQGTPVAPSTLTKLRCVGGGPIFQLFGRKPVYTPEQLTEYALSRLSAERRSTSEAAQIGSPRQLRRVAEAGKRNIYDGQRFLGAIAMDGRSAWCAYGLSGRQIGVYPSARSATEAVLETATASAELPDLKTSR